MWNEFTTRYLLLQYKAPAPKYMGGKTTAAAPSMYDDGLYGTSSGGGSFCYTLMRLCHVYLICFKCQPCH